MTFRLFLFDQEVSYAVLNRGAVFCHYTHQIHLTLTCFYFALGICHSIGKSRLFILYGLINWLHSFFEEQQWSVSGDDRHCHYYAVHCNKWVSLSCIIMVMKPPLPLTIYHIVLPGNYWINTFHMVFFIWFQDAQWFLPWSYLNVTRSIVLHAITQSSQLMPDLVSVCFNLPSSRPVGLMWYCDL